MKLTINGTQLKNVYKKVAKAVPRNSTMEILNGVQIKATNEKLMMAATDMREGIKSYVMDPSYNCVEEGEIVVESKLLSGILNEVDGQVVTLELTQRRLKIHGNGFDFKIRYQESDEFPQLRNINTEALTVELDSEFMKEFIKKSTVACSVDEARPVLTGVELKMDGNLFTYAALDGYRLAYGYQNFEENLGDFQSIVPQEFLRDLSSLLEPGTTKVHIGENYIAFELDDENNTVLVGRLLEGSFPNINAIKDSERPNTLTMNRRELMASLKRANLIANMGELTPLKMSFSNNTLSIEVSNKIGDFEEELEINYDGDELVFGFNTNYLMTGLQAFDSENITLNFSTGLSPCLLTSDEETYEHLILPIRLKG